MITILVLFLFIAPVYIAYNFTQNYKQYKLTPQQPYKMNLIVYGSLIVLYIVSAIFIAIGPEYFTSELPAFIFSLVVFLGIPCSFLYTSIVSHTMYKNEQDETIKKEYKKKSIMNLIIFAVLIFLILVFIYSTTMAISHM